MFSALLICCIFISTLILWLAYTRYFKPYYIVKRSIGLHGPPTKFFSGNLWELTKFGYLETMEKWLSQYGPTFIIYFGIKPAIVTEDVEVIKSIMVKNFDSFINRIRVPALLTKRDWPDLLQFRGEQWRRARRTVMPSFSTKKLKMMSPLIQDACERLRDKMAAFSDTNNSVDVWKWFGIFTMEVTLAIMFSRDINLENGQENPLIKAIHSVFDMGRSGNDGLDIERMAMIISHFPWCLPLLKIIARRTRVAQSWDCIEETALKTIEGRQMATSGSTAKDLLQLMLEAQEDNKHLSIDELVFTVMSTIFGAQESTSNALSYTAYLLALNPTIQDKLVKEINDYYETNPDCSLYDAAENIEYVNMVLCESLRMYPPFPRTFRECNRTCAVTDGLIIEKGYDVIIPISLLHRSPKYWPNPDKFDPERFNPNNKQPYPTFAFIPFGEGPRHCIGKRLALIKAKMTLVAILKELQFRRSADTEVPLSLGVTVGLTPMNGLKLCIVSNSV